MPSRLWSREPCPPSFYPKTRELGGDRRCRRCRRADDGDRPGVWTWRPDRMRAREAMAKGQLVACARTERGDLQVPEIMWENSGGAGSRNLRSRNQKPKAGRDLGR